MRCGCTCQCGRCRDGNRAEPGCKLQYESARHDAEARRTEPRRCAGALRPSSSPPVRISLRRSRRSGRAPEAHQLRGRGMGAMASCERRCMGVVSKLDVTAGSLVASGSRCSRSLRTSTSKRVSPGERHVAQLAAGQSVTLQSMSRPEASCCHVDRARGGARSTQRPDRRMSVSRYPQRRPCCWVSTSGPSIEVEKKDSALVVPRSAVLPDADKQVLFTVRTARACVTKSTLDFGGDRVEVQAPDLHPGMRL